jgi:small subunit ribosomal protein S18
VAREMALLPYAKRVASTRTGGRRGDRDERRGGDREERDSSKEGGAEGAENTENTDELVNQVEGQVEESATETAED